jgi:hypothetical protein
MRMLKCGDKVMIYEDPVTKEKPEGQATLRELYRSVGTLTIWRVVFDDEPGQYYERSIDGEDTDEKATEE